MGGPILRHGPNINHEKPPRTLSHHSAPKFIRATPLLDAAARLNLGSCETMTLPMRRSADVPVGIGVWAVRSSLKKRALSYFCSKPTRVGFVDLGDSIGLPSRGALEGFDGAGFIEVKNRIELL